MEYPQNWPNYKPELFRDESITSQELKAFVHDGSTKYGKDYDYYFENWKSLLESKSGYSGFNWSSFFFGFLWFLFRRLTSYALTLFIFEVLVLSIIYNTVIYLFDDFENFNSAYTLINIILLLLFRVLIGFISNRLYLMKATKSIIRARFKTTTIEDRIHFLTIKGGTDSRAVFAGLIISILFRFVFKNIF